MKSKTLNGTSVFDPVLCEILCKWFGFTGGTVFDPFAGGAVRGVVCHMMGMSYIGIDLMAEQVQDNKRIAQQLDVSPVWYCDDSINADKYLEDESADLILTCPPYADLERYSDDERDLSTMEYGDFVEKYRKILSIAAKKLKPNRFAAITVSEIRDKRGFYHHFVSDTERIMEDAGARFYNEIILIKMPGTLPVRVRKHFDSYRKVGKRHENVLIFYKGDVKEIKNIYPKSKIDEKLEGGDEDGTT